MINLTGCLNGMQIRGILLYLHILESILVCNKSCNIIAAHKYLFSLFQTLIDTSSTVTEGPSGLGNTERK